MDQYEFIRTGHRIYGKSISELARTTGHSRNTVKKAIRGEPWSYKEREHQPFPVLGPFMEIIDGWLESDKKQPRKQRHTARRIYNRMVEEHGYTGCEATVRRYVRYAKVKLGVDAPKAFIPCDPEAGYEAEVDWGNAKAIIRGEEILLKYFCMRSKYSGKHFIRCYPCERQQAFFDAHIHGFEFFGGVFPVIIYDNLTSAVQKVLRGRNRKEQEAFQKFKAYYSIESRFCNPNSGHEKGGVEGFVGFGRRNYMVPIPEAESLSELNEKLLRRCLAYGSHKISGREHTVNELYEKEKERLICLPEAVFSNIQTRDVRVDKYATAIVDKNRYSVPAKYAGFKAKAVVAVEEVQLFVCGKKVATHNRMYGNNKWSLDPDHYLDLIYQRPMAFNSARPIRQWQAVWPESLNLLLSSFRQSQGDTDGTKDFISVLMLYRDHTSDEVEAAVDLALENNIHTSDGVRHILLYTNEKKAVISSLPHWPSLPLPDVSVYGQLGGAL